jgi:ubiquinone/menaquinone biosynthesis C-methylase UbiE
LLVESDGISLKFTAPQNVEVIRGFSLRSAYDRANLGAGRSPIVIKRLGMADKTTTETPTELGRRTHVEAILDALGSVQGLEVFDVGCGEAQTSRELAGAGARVSGFDPFIEAADWTANGTGRFRLVKASADALPVDDGSADVVLFIFSLHHVPNPKLAPALIEARRVLKPSGRLLVAEPLARGPGHYVSAPFHDETAVRAAAAAAVRSDAVPHFGTHQVFSYDEHRRWESFERYAERMIRNRRFNGYTEEAVLAPEVRRRFDEMFPTGGGSFEQPVRIDLFSQPAKEVA